MKEGKCGGYGNGEGGLILLTKYLRVNNSVGCKEYIRDIRPCRPSSGKKLNDTQNFLVKKNDSVVVFAFLKK